MSKTASLQKDNVIPDVLPQSTSPSYDLTVKWPSATLSSAGKELGREDTQPEPTLHLSPTPQDTSTKYTLIMTDPDLMATNDTSFGQVRHWLATNVTVDTSGQLDIPKESNVSTYIGPAPLPNYITPRPHRYVFILAKSPGESSVNVTAEDLNELQKQYGAAFDGKQELQDLKDRWGFNAQQLLEKKNLTVEAATYMFVGGTLKSAVDNVAMTAQASVNKVVGN